MNNPRQPDPDAQDKVADNVPKQSKTDLGNPQSIAHSTEDAIGEQTYTVQSGDTLSHIAEQFYGTAGAWKQIFEANRDQLDDPDLIKPGQVLKVPPKTD